ncbi:MAG: glycosyltransferase [Planctomycetes bacterium]|nr:glycosyltransferase [Planctomycetota bacterium]MCB9909245.1 glycosyltransferase [Planctomycetota bacterium]HPF13479.1 glycosyltransferase [Planctomycetota bacterium]
MNSKRSLRIALIVDPFMLRMKGGDHAPVLSSELLGRGHQVRGFGAPPGVIPRSRIETIGAKDGLGVIAFRPDVVIAYDALSPAGWHGMRCARKLGVPLIAVEEGFPSTGGFFERRLRGIGEFLWGRAVRRATTRVLALDPFAQAQAVRRGFDPALVRVVPRGLDLEQFRPGLASNLAARHGATGLSLLYLGPLEDGYHLETVIKAFAATVGQREDWALLLASDGAQRSTFLAQASRLGVGSRVHWLGRVRREELPGLLASSTLLVAPGGDRVADGVLASRALACGLPILAAKLPRYEIAVEHGQTGLLLEPGRLADWSDGIRLAAGSPRRRQAWRLRSRELAEERFHWPTIGAHIEALLIEAIDQVQSRKRLPSRTPEEVASEAASEERSQHLAEPS